MKSIKYLREHLHIPIFIVIAIIMCAKYLYDSRTIDTLSTEMNVAETLFKQLFKDDGSGMRDSTCGYYLRIKGLNPTADFINRFAGYKHAVKAGWRFKEGRGVLFSISDFQFFDGSTCKARGDYYAHSLAGSGSIFTIRKKNNIWIVEDIEILWYS